MGRSVVVYDQTSDETLLGDSTTYPDSTHEPEVALAQGLHLGRYIILEKLGEGGMGVVYKAWDPDLNRPIALKFLRFADAGQAHQSPARVRLLREAQALARLSHPNVIAVFDVGTFENSVFLAMEFVEGRSLRQWIEDEQPDAGRILKVMTAAGRGLLAAHLAGVVHRDFKPENLIISEDDRVRVLDFGLAVAAMADELREESGSELGVSALTHTQDDVDVTQKQTPRLEHALDRSDELISQPESTSGEDLLHSVITQVGAVIGTPAYMPVQQHLGQTTDARSDQFSFCATLYEALFSVRPYSGRTRKELVNNLLAERIQAPLTRPKELLWVRKLLERGLRADPGDRFGSMSELLQELENDPAIWRRKILSFTGVVLLALTALVAIVASLTAKGQLCQGAQKRMQGVWDSQVQQQVRQSFQAVNEAYVAHAWMRVHTLLDRYTQDWLAGHRQACEATQVRGEQSESLMDLRMLCLEHNRLDLKALIDLFVQADRQVVEKSVKAVMSLRPINHCADVDSLQAGVKPALDPIVRDRVEKLRMQLAQANALEQTGKYERGIQVANQLAEAADKTKYRPLMAQVLFRKGSIELLAGEFDAAKVDLHKASLLADAASFDEVRVQALNKLLFLTGYHRTDYEQAASLSQMVLAVLDRLGPRSTISLKNRAEWHNYFGVIEYVKGEYDLALKHFKDALQIQQKLYGQDHPHMAYTYIGLGNLWTLKGDHKKAQDALRRVLAIRSDVYGAQHPRVAMSHNNLGVELMTAGDLDAAAQQFTKALTIWENSLGPQHVNLAYALNNLGMIFAKKGKFDQGIAYIDRALHIRQAKLGQEHPKVALALYYRASVLFENKKYKQAEENFAQAIAMGEKLFGGQHPSLAESLMGLAKVYMAQHRYKKAIARFRRAWNICQKKTCNANAIPSIQFAWAKAIVATRGDRTKAISLAQQAYVYCQKQVHLQQQAREIKNWLSQHS